MLRGAETLICRGYTPNQVLAKLQERLQKTRPQSDALIVLFLSGRLVNERHWLARRLAGFSGSDFLLIPSAGLLLDSESTPEESSALVFFCRRAKVVSPQDLEKKMNEEGATIGFVFSSAEQGVLSPAPHPTKDDVGQSLGRARSSLPPTDGGAAYRGARPLIIESELPESQSIIFIEAGSSKESHAFYLQSEGRALMQLSQMLKVLGPFQRAEIAGTSEIRRIDGRPALTVLSELSPAGGEPRLILLAERSPQSSEPPPPPAERAARLSTGWLTAEQTLRLLEEEPRASSEASHPAPHRGRAFAIRGVDPKRGSLLVQGELKPGLSYAFATPSAHLARRDLQARVELLKKDSAGSQPIALLCFLAAGRARGQTAQSDLQVLRSAFPQLPVYGILQQRVKRSGDPYFHDFATLLALFNSSS